MTRCYVRHELAPGVHQDIPHYHEDNHKMTRMSQKEFRKILTRDGDHCPHCGTTEGLVPHHRKNRKMGGSRRLETPSNTLAVCSLLNNLMESDPQTAEWARERGWKLRNNQDPAATPVKDNTANAWFLLDDNYGRTEVGR
jgi:hypothetical protein